MRNPLRAALLAALTLAIAGPAAAQEPVEPAGPDAWTSPNVEYLGTIKQDVGLTTGARVVPSTEPGVPDKLFVHNAKNFTIYDISTPSKPKTMGTIHLNVAWEGEEIPTDGKVVVLADDYLIADPMCGTPAEGLVSVPTVMEHRGCVQFFDARYPANVREVAAIPAQNHTAECAAPKEDNTNDCEYVYGSYGTIIDARGVLDGKAPTVIGNWITDLKLTKQVDEKSCHHIRQLRPGVLLTACRPFAAISINAEDGGSPAHPVLLADGSSPKFVHSARWPRGGTDKFVLTGGELNFRGTCDTVDPAGATGNDSEFKVFNAEAVLQGQSRDFGPPTAELTPTNGTYTDGNAPAGELGCSVHWFQEHPSFHDGGLVALSQYENGVKFLQITPGGQIKQKGYFISAGSSSSSPKWAPDGHTVYSIDYHRGIDILRYNGCLYVPGKPACGPGEIYGTDDQPPAAALRAAHRGQARLLAQMRAVGWFPGYCQLTVERNAPR